MIEMDFCGYFGIQSLSQQCRNLAALPEFDRTYIVLIDLSGGSKIELSNNG
jgi:hypothetical protein